MFNLQFSEILMVLVVALILLGPKRLPQVARMLARGLREIRKAGQDLREAWESEVEESGGADLRALRSLRDPGALVDEAWTLDASVARGSASGAEAKDPDTTEAEASSEAEAPAETPEAHEPDVGSGGDGA